MTTRRSFLATGAVATTGLVIGFTWPMDRHAAASSTFEPNAWLRVDPGGRVTVTVARSEMGQGVQTSLPMLVAEELGVDWKDVRFEQAIPKPAYGDMSTGGSRSIVTSWDPLRKAGAQAREMLIAAAAATWGVDRASCRAEGGAVLHPPSGRRLAYGELVEAAASLPEPEDPPLTDPKDWKIIGTRVPRLDTAAKVDGSAVFGLDVRVPGMLTAVVARSPVFGGRVASFDPAPARAVPGVKHVEQIASGIAVVADNLWAAWKGRDALKITWNEGALAELESAAIRAQWADLAAKPGAIGELRGDGAKGLAGAARSIEAIYEVPYLAHATMEPMNATAHVTAGRCEVWVPTQSATGAQERAAALTGLDPERVIVHTTYLGGGFGRRAEQDFLAEAIEISKAVGAPVQVVWSREDDMRHDFYRPATYNVLRAGFDAGGHLLAWTHHIVGPAILGRVAPAAIRDGIDGTSLEGAWHLPYAIENLEVAYTLHDPGIPVGWWRSVGSSQNAFVTECFLDEVAAAAGRDPLDLRRELLAAAPRHRAVLDLAAEKAGWGVSPGSGRGKGLAVHESFGSIVAVCAEVAVAQGAVRVERVVCAVDCGTVVNPDTVEAQMESGILFGLSAALKQEITIEKGRVVQSNFDDYPMLALDEAPAIAVHLAPSGAELGGIGEPGVPPAAPALVNAVFAATGKRVRRLPIRAADLGRG